MSNTKMLIDATHPEETRVVVQRNGRVEEFDFESAARKLLRGNIYLAKVTRVEPSLQAAFVDYGGNRHGFLAFNEIHPDYYQIPVADRQALLEEEAAAEAELEAAADRRAEALARRSSERDVNGSATAEESASDEAADDFSETGAKGSTSGTAHIVDVEEEELIEEVGGTEEGDEPVKVIPVTSRDRSDDGRSEPVAEEDEQPDNVAGEGDEASSEDASEQGEADSRPPEAEENGAIDEDENADSDANSDFSAPEAARDGGRGRSGEEGAYRPARQRRRPRSYKIQEVIKRRQIILVQVVKEERGNKGAALTTYLSLAGRYTVLMPNTARGGGISRKITNPQDRRRLKAIAQELEVPEGMGLIIRTAGAARTKQEIKRDFEYLLRLWESVRELTLQSTAPSLVYEEGDLIKRSIRDLYNKDVEEIVVAGEAGYQEAADFMKMLMPSHSKNVVPYKEPTPLFTRYGVERQLNAMFQPQVTLRSGGYIVINQTEALVAIDVNSGKSTREFSIEETALATNLEAADEIARQLKLRDLAGLIVIDFIDMEEKRNNRSVERRLKDALRFDRARIQLGRISHFGLMEMSRQRLRTGVLEGSTSQCPHCQGTGIIRSTESIALAVLRGLEDAITAGAAGPLVATTTPTVALYILNSKRGYIGDMEVRHGHPITVLGSDRVHGANFTVERSGTAALPVRRVERAAVNMDWGFDGSEDPPSFDGSEIEIITDVVEGEEETSPQEEVRRDGDDGAMRRGRRRRRRGRGGRERGEGRFQSSPRSDLDATDAAQPNLVSADEPDEDFAEDREGGEQAAPEGSYERTDEDGRPERGRRRRRGRRGGRRGREREDGSFENGAAAGGPSEAQEDEIVSEGEGSLRADATRNSGAERSGSTTEEDATAHRAPKAKSQRPSRIWDVPSASNGAENGNDGSPEDVTFDVGRAEKPSAGEPEAAAAAQGRRRHETGSSEPRLERVVVKPGEEVTSGGEVQAPPQRKGWWQRKFGGE